MVPFFIYSILLVAKDTFTEENTKENYNRKSYNIIKIINRCLFIYDAFIIVGSLLYIFYIYKNFSYDYGKKKYLKLCFKYL